MIHLDRNHHHPSPLSPHSNSNLILQQDQIKILSSQALSRDEPKSEQPQEDPFLANDLFDFNVTDIQEPDPVGVDEPVASEVAVDADAVNEDVEEPVAAPEADPTPTDPPIEEHPTSPKPDRSSSLSPPPTDDAVASPKLTEAVEEEFPVTTEETVEATVEDSEDARAEEPAAKTEAEEERMGSPLSELSPAPEHEEPESAQQKGDEAQGVEGNASEEMAKVEEEESKVEEVSMEHSEPNSATAVPAEQTNTLASPPAIKPSSSPPQRMSIEPDSSTPAPAKSPSTSNVPEKEAQSASRPSSVSRPASSTPAPPSTDKGVRLLELNAELLKVYMAFGTHGIPVSDPRAQEFATRLQSNLTWLASAADGHRQGNPPLPSMEAPAAVDFISMDRVTQLYADLPTIFASDIARRQQAMASRQPSLAPSTSSSNLKRDRTEEVELNIANKRQNTGDNKSPPLRPPTVPPTPALMGSPAPPAASFPMSNNGSSGAMGNISQPPMQGMPSIAPPALPQGFTGLQPGQGATEAQVTAAAERDRARQQQIQDAIRRNQLQQQQQNNRQMSPPSNQGGAPSMPGQGQGQPRPGSGLPNIDFSSPRAVEHFGPNAVQNMQVLQTPTHAFTQYLHAKIPGFDSMPLPQQLQKMHQVQILLKQQGQPMQGGGQQRGPMPGLPQQQNPMQSLQNNGMRGQQFGGGATSPTSMGQQQQQNGQFQPQMNAGGNMPNPQLMGNMGQINLGNLSPQDRQRQLMMMQQQQQRNQAGGGGGGGGGGGSGQNPGFMNNEQYAMAQERFRQEQQQRMSQGGSNAGSPPGGSVNDFPALRSNGSIPGIARSTRSPSDGAQSPMSPQMQRNFQPDMRRLMAAGMAGNAGGMGGQMPGQNPPLPNWQLKNQHTQQQQQQQQQQQAMPMGHLQPPSGNQYGGQSQNQWSGYPLAPSPNSGGFQPERSGTPRQTSQTPAPQQQMQAHSPPAQGGEFDLFNWSGGS